MEQLAVEHPPLHLIYWDPPFFSGKVQAADKGFFDDRWTSLEEYLQALQPDLERMADHLEIDGFFALHCDWHASHYLKAMGDRVFGYPNFRNEIVWHYSGRRQPAKVRLNAKHDVILIWAKSPSASMQPLAEPWTRDTYVKLKRQTVHVDEDGREWIWGHRGRGQPHAYRIYLDEAVARGKPLDDVWDIPIINTSAAERVGYPTQKPLQLLRQLIALLTKPEQWIGDFMAGSGTTGVAALELGRGAVLGDVSEDAMAVMRWRLQSVMAQPQLPLR